MRILFLKFTFKCLALLFLLGLSVDKPENNFRSQPNTKTCKQNAPLSTKEVAKHLKKAGFPKQEIARMVCIAKWESEYKAHAININKNGIRDLGLFQINAGWWGITALDGCGYSDEELLQAKYNAHCAFKVYQTQGLHAWYGYRYHKEECDKFRL